VERDQDGNLRLILTNDAYNWRLLSALEQKEQFNKVLREAGIRQNISGRYI
jgi:hypothetical protein